jgi:ankyrin repeat protein
LYSPVTTISETSKKWLFCFFAPEIEDANPNFFAQIIQLFEPKAPDTFLQTVFNDFIESIDTLRKDQWKVLKSLRDSEFDSNHLSSILAHDYLSYLLHEAASSLFNVNERIEPSIFALSDFVQHRPTLIQYAAYFGSSKCLKYLLSINASTSLPDESGVRFADYLVAGNRLSFLGYIDVLHLDTKTILQTSIVHHHFAKFERIYNTKLSEGCGSAPIQTAIVVNSLKVFLFCLDREMPFDSGWRCGNTALHMAAFHGNLTMCKVLLMLEPEKLNCANAAGRTPLYQAISSLNDKVVLFFLEQERVCPSVTDLANKTPLHVAAESGMGSIVRLILSMDVDINAKDGRRGECDFMRTIPKGKLLPAQEVALIDRDRVRHAKSSLCGRTPLHLAVALSKAEAVETLLMQFGIDPNSTNSAGQTPLERAADIGNATIVKLLLAHPQIDVNAADRLGWTPLHSACCRCNLEAVRLLLNDDRIDINQRRLPGRSPLHDAADRGHPQIVDLLMLHPQCELNPRDACNMTPLHWAIERKWSETARLLVENPNVVVTTQDLTGETPLHRAVKRNQVAIVTALLKRNEVDVNATDGSGVTPILLAARMGHLNAVKLLLSHRWIHPTIADRHGVRFLFIKHH